MIRSLSTILYLFGFTLTWNLFIIVQDHVWSIGLLATMGVCAAGVWVAGEREERE